MSILLRIPRYTKTHKLGWGELSRRSLASSTKTTATIEPLTPTTPLDFSGEWKTIYRFPLIRAAAALNRLKVYQALISIIGIPSSFAFEVAGLLPNGMGMTCTAVGVSLLMTLTLTSFAVQNLLGFIYVNATKDKLKLAYVDFWGRRQNVVVDVEDMIPAWEQAKSLQLIFYQTILLRSNKNLKYKLLTRYGVIEEPEIFSELFGE